MNIIEIDSNIADYKEGLSHKNELLFSNVCGIHDTNVCGSHHTNVCGSHDTNVCGSHDTNVCGSHDTLCDSHKLEGVKGSS